MTWFFVVSLVILSLVKITVASPPTFLAEWFVHKFQLHPKLEEKDITIKKGERLLEGEEKGQMLHGFNEGTFLNRYDISPRRSGTPLVFEERKGKKTLIFFVYPYSDHVDVFKQNRKSTVAYRLFAEQLHEKVEN
ncbi:YfmQ family protein [Priestia endophytica]|uniref:YfmQ family protein n=1 Tax=Priestia endophytica TaxID=135735 RepID=UPI00227F1351|nr:YfmQ family protein [Priestia endophytica]MCY8234870.1 YfmQ family protein [Priestia endophytica]